MSIKVERGEDGSSRLTCSDTGTFDTAASKRDRVRQADTGYTPAFAFGTWHAFTKLLRNSSAGIACDALGVYQW